MIPTTVGTVLSDVLAACVAAYTQPGAPDAPTRGFIAHGSPVTWEGEQLTVAAVNISPVHPHPLIQQRAVKTSIVPSLALNIECVRGCWPVPRSGGAPSSQMPDPGAFTAAAERLALDASTIFGWIANLAARGGLIPSLPTISTAHDIALGSMVPTGPSAQLVGWRWPIAVKLTVPGT